MNNELLKLHFDDQGKLINVHEQRAIFDALLSPERAITDLWVFAHGWNTDEASANRTYALWQQEMQESIRREKRNREYRPAFLGIYWPSIAWIEDTPLESAIPVSSSTKTTQIEFDVDDHGEENIEFDFHEEFGELELSSDSPVSEAEKRKNFFSIYNSLRGSNVSAMAVNGEDLFALLYQKQYLTPENIMKFAQILQHLRIVDPHEEVFESSRPVDTSHLLLHHLGNDLYNEGYRPGNPLISLFRAFTFWNMKARAGIVGQNGVAPFLKDLKMLLDTHKRTLRIHLFGHSFGAKLVSSSAYTLAQLLTDEHPVIDSLTLLLGAFSQFAFSGNIPGLAGASGRYAPLLDRRIIKNPIVAVYSRHDLANKELYPLGMRLANPNLLFEMGGPEDQFGAIGANGAQGIDPFLCSSIVLKPVTETYSRQEWHASSLLNVEAEAFINANKGKRPIGAHGDTGRPEIFHLAQAIIADRDAQLHS